MGCGIKLIKYLMFFFNLLVFLSGAALLAVGIWVLVAGDSFKRMVSSDAIIFNSVYIIIAVGAALFLIGFLGCCGAIQESRCLLGTFFAVVLILFLLQIVGAILAIALQSQAESETKKAMNNGDEDMLNAWNEFQKEFECCGIDGPKDWNTVPRSCCNSVTRVCNATTAYQNGCKDKTSQMMWILAGISLGILAVELLAMIFSCLLFHEIGKNPDYS